MNPPIQPRLPGFAQFWCNATPFRINTCKSVSKQTTLTPFRMNTYEKRPGGGGVHFLLITFLTSLLRYLVPSRNGGALSAVMGASAKRAFRLQERRSSTGQRLSFLAVEAEANSLEISFRGLARWCSPRALRTVSPAVPSAGYSSVCRWYFQNGDRNACS